MEVVEKAGEVELQELQMRQFREDTEFKKFQELLQHEQKISGMESELHVTRTKLEKENATL